VVATWIIYATTKDMKEAFYEDAASAESLAVSVVDRTITVNEDVLRYGALDDPSSLKGYTYSKVLVRGNSEVDLERLKAILPEAYL
tara:strand:- start:1140 stop:1397 length:258 start_codon:yes stop_codon:yes gene_type:complete